MEPGYKNTMDLIYREAIQSSQPVTSFVTKADIDLLKTADNSPWEPSRDIRKEVPNYDEIQVELVNEETNLVDVYNKLLKQSFVGLVVLGRNIGRHSKPSLIVLTTKDKFYAIDPNDTERGIAFLRLRIQENKIKFYLSNGLEESDCLYHNYGIDLTEAKADCCTGRHIYLMQSMRHKTACANSMYPATTKDMCRRRIRIERFDKLVEIWLSIDKNEIYYDMAQIQHLNTRPLSITATNIIMKRCTLLRRLAQCLDFYSWLEIKVMSQNTFDRLVFGNEQVRKAMIRVMRRNEEKGEADLGFYAHFDTGLSSS